MKAREAYMTKIGWQDQSSYRKNSYENWQNRISKPKGNPNTWQFRQAQEANTSGIQAEYQRYTQQCIQNGQTPMSPAEYIQCRQSGIDPSKMQDLQTGVAAGTTIANSISNILSTFGIKGGAKTQSITQEQITLLNNVATGITSGSEVKIDNLKNFVNAEFAQMNANGDSVTTAQFAQHLQDVKFADSEEEAKLLMTAIDVPDKNGTSDGKISKKELTAFYKKAMGNSNTLSQTKIQNVVMESMNKIDQQLDNSNTNRAMENLGYKYETRTINGEETGVFVKGEEVISLGTEAGMTRISELIMGDE